MAEHTASTPPAVTAFAPASVANVAVGFDVLGFAIGGFGDRVTLRPDPSRPEIRITDIRGIPDPLPLDPARNTATVALLEMLAAHPVPFGLDVRIDKGIPLGSGMGGSAASAVAAVVALNGLLNVPASSDALLRYATAGEAVASGAIHADNVAPCLLGGMTAVVGHDPLEVASLPVPPGLCVVVVHPHLQIETRAARAAMDRPLSVEEHVHQSMHLAGFLSACFAGDRQALGRSMVDLIAEPARAPLIPGFKEARKAALAEGALSLSISGSGPTVFAWVESPAVGRAVEAAIRDAFQSISIGTDAWSGPVRMQGAQIVDGGADA